MANQRLGGGAVPDAEERSRRVDGARHSIYGARALFSPNQSFFFRNAHCTVMSNDGGLSPDRIAFTASDLSVRLVQLFRLSCQFSPDLS
jgi:hypothetical protein